MINLSLLCYLIYGSVDDSLHIYEDQPASDKWLESFGIPMIGSSASVREIYQNKSIANNFLKSKGINTPEEVTLDNIDINIDYIVKNL